MEFEDITYFLDNNQSKFSVICVRFMYEYLALCYIFFFFNQTPFVFFLKTFLVLALNATGKSQMERYYTATKLNNITCSNIFHLAHSIRLSSVFILYLNVKLLGSLVYINAV